MTWDPFMTYLSVQPCQLPALECDIFPLLAMSFKLSSQKLFRVSFHEVYDRMFTHSLFLLLTYPTYAWLHLADWAANRNLTTMRTVFPVGTKQSRL